jgi:hypothetical protein
VRNNNRGDARQQYIIMDEVEGNNCLRKEKNRIALRVLRNYRVKRKMAASCFFLFIPFERKTTTTTTGRFLLLPIHSV